MENIGIIKLKEELEKANPHVQLDFTTIYGVPFDEYIKYYSFGCMEFVIYGSVPGKNLNLPAGYYYNEKITNKHNTASGLYESFSYKYDVNHFAPKAEPKKTKKSLFARLFA